MDCCVVIPACNNERFIAETIESVLGQTRPAAQIVVVDDGSDDATPEILERFGDRIEVVRQDRQGFAAARNRGIEACRCDLVAFLDSDDIAEPSRHEKFVETLSGDAEAAMAFSSARLIDDTGQGASRPMREVQYARKRFFGLMLVRNRIVSCSAVVARRDALEQVGGFDENLAHNEDYDLWLRIARRHPVAYIQEPLVRYRLNKKNVSQDRALHHRTEVMALRKHSPDVIRDALETAYDSYRDVEMAYARVLVSMEEYEKAERALNQLQEDDYKDSALHFFLGNIHLVRGDIDRAAEELREAVMLDDTAAAACNNLGVALAVQGRENEARQSFEMARALRLEYSDPAINLRILREGGSPRTMRLTFNLMRSTLKPEFGPVEWPDE